MGIAGYFRFFPSKNLGGVGDGGMIVTNDEEYYNRLLIMRNHGSKPKYYHKFVGGNSVWTPSRQPHFWLNFHTWISGRENAEKMRLIMTGISRALLFGPYIFTDCITIYNQYCIRVSQCDEVMAYLRENNIGCEIYYPVPMHLQECFKYLKYKKGDFPQAEKAAKEVLALPVYLELTDKMKDYVVDTILSYGGES